MNVISRLKDIRTYHSIGWAISAVVTFHMASSWPVVASLMVVFFFCLIKASQEGCGRRNFYLGLAIGIGIYSWQLRFFTNIFSGAALILWLVLALWIGLFMMLASHYQRRRSVLLQWVMLTCAWMALEYFRGELYFLKFTWATPGFAFSGLQGAPLLGILGVYGISGLCVTFAAAALLFPQKYQIPWILITTVGLGLIANYKTSPNSPPQPTSQNIHVGGLHLENPGSSQGIKTLDQFMTSHPETELILLAEYSFFGEPPQSLLEWCQSRQVHLVVGGTQPLEDETYYNTAFVISPQGEIVFKQVKSVPIQFFNDGLPAVNQEVWQSPWGPIGICICYDLSYSRVTDTLIKKGARMILVPTLDELHWGQSQHALHARVAPVRAAEYGVPIFRVGACGISQAVDATGDVKAATQFPGTKAKLHATLTPTNAGSIPLDRYLVWLCLGIVGLDLARHLVARKRETAT